MLTQEVSQCNTKLELTQHTIQDLLKDRTSRFTRTQHDVHRSVNLPKLRFDTERDISSVNKINILKKSIQSPFEHRNKEGINLNKFE